MFLLPSRRKFVKDRYNSQPADDDRTLFSGMAPISQLTTTTSEGGSWDKEGGHTRDRFVERMKGGAFWGGLRRRQRTAMILLWKWTWSNQSHIFFPSYFGRSSLLLGLCILMMMCSGCVRDISDNDDDQEYRVHQRLKSWRSKGKDG